MDKDELRLTLEAAQESNCLLIDQIDAYQRQHDEDVRNLTEKSADIDRLQNQISQFQKLVMAKSAQVRAETALRVAAEKRLADIMELLEPIDPPESYAAVVDKIAILANSDRYACDPIHEPSPICCEYHKDGGDTIAECFNFKDYSEPA